MRSANALSGGEIVVLNFFLAQPHLKNNSSSGKGFIDISAHNDFTKAALFWRHNFKFYCAYNFKAATLL